MRSATGGTYCPDEETNPAARPKNASARPGAILFAPQSYPLGCAEDSSRHPKAIFRVDKKTHFACYPLAFVMCFRPFRSAKAYLRAWNFYFSVDQLAVSAVSIAHFYLFRSCFPDLFL